MQALAAALRDLQLVAYGLLVAIALWQYRRRRLVAARYLAAAFAALAWGLAAGRLAAATGGTAGDVARFGAVLGIAGFPWLLAAFAWSFAGRLPRWLRAAWAPVVAIAALYLVTGSGQRAGGRTGGDAVFLVALLVVWLVPSVATTVRLWDAGGSTSRIVRARMRLIAGSVIVLSAALVVGIATPTSAPNLTRVVTASLSLAAAGLALAGFAPPLPLRLWWRRKGAHQFQLMQQELIAAVTPDDAARAVVPILADHIGAGAAVLADDGELLAHREISPPEAREALRRYTTDGQPPPGTRVLPLGRATLVVRLTGYSPFFGDYERELVAAYAWQLQLALERSELAAMHLEARHAAERSGRELETMLIGLAHDLRSPAVAISGYATLLRSAETEAEREHMIEGIADSSGYLNGLVDALLELSRIGRTQTTTEPVDLVALGRTVAKRVAVTHPQTDVRVDEDLPVVVLNPVRAEQLIDNLVSNAVKHGGRADLTVRIEGHHTADAFELLVADDGVGIPREDRERVFDLFRRGRDAGAPGAGVGLGMVRRIAEQYGGEVRLEDGAVGAQFVVSFPRAVLQDAATVGRQAL